MGERRGRPAAVLRRSREATRCPRRPGSWSSSPTTWPSTSPATKNARPSPNGSRRAPCTTSAGAVGVPRPTRSCSCPTTVAGASTPRRTISPGAVKWSPARSWAMTATCMSRCGSIPPTLKPAASRWATSSWSTTSAVSCSAAPGCGNVSCPGMAYVDHGARHDPIIPGKVDRGGAINTISGDWISSKNARRPGHQRLPGGGQPAACGP